MNNKWFLIVVLFLFTAFCQIQPGKARGAFEEISEIPDRTPLIEKIREAQTIALTAEQSFQNTLEMLHDAQSELVALQKKQKLSQKYKERITELKSVVEKLTILKLRLLEKTLLVILNRESGELRSIYIQEPEYEPKKINTHIAPFYRSYTPECFVTKIDGNGHGKNLFVLCENRVMPMLALAHFHEKKGRYSWDISHVYTPYSPQIHDPAIIAEGKKYLPQKIQNAIESLREKRVPSQAYPGEFVHWKFSPDFISAIIINEHMDHDEFISAMTEEEEKTEQKNENAIKRRSAITPLVEKFFTVLGANTERAYIFSVSKSRACCFAQFIGSTFHLVQKEYPEAKLSKNFFAVMRDHTSAVEAMILLFDRDLSQFTPHARELCESSQELLEDCIAVSYNGGVNRLNAVIKTYGENWDMQKAVRKGKRFLKKGLTYETHIYLQKIRAIRKLEK
ncbi:MAG: hypothetical protein AAB362_01000 [Patescibacteria group bacterium]